MMLLWLSGLLLPVLFSSASCQMSQQASLKSEPDILDGQFRLQAAVKIYHNNKLTWRLRSHERYSKDRSRAIIELIVSKNREKPSVYYHDVSLSSNQQKPIWLLHRPAEEFSSRCIVTEEDQFMLELYGDSLLAQLIKSLIAKESLGLTIDRGHLVGLGKLMFLIRKLKKSSVQPKLALIREVEMATFEVQLELNLESNVAKNNYAVNIELEYDANQLERLKDLDTLPLQLRIVFRRIGDGDSPLIEMVVNFLSLSHIDDEEMISSSFVGSPSLTNEFLFPLNSGCSKSLEAFRPAENSNSLINTMNQSAKLSFTAKISNHNHVHKYREENTVFRSEIRGSSSEQSLFIALDRRNQLIRRDILYEDPVKKISTISSRTIYDFNANKKFNVIVDDPDSISNEASQLNINCVSSRIGSSAPRKDIGNNYEFFNIGRLQFMGELYLDGRRVEVYEETEAERIPFWLSPPTMIEQNNETRILSDSSSHITLIYYFSLSKEGLYQPLSLSLAKRNQESFQQSISLRVSFNSFRYDLHQEPTTTRSLTFLSATRGIFSLTDFCSSLNPVSMLNGKYRDTRVSLLLRSLKEDPMDLLYGNDMVRILKSRLSNHLTRDDILLDSLIENLSLPVISIDRLNSYTPLWRPQKTTRGHFSYQLPKIGFNFHLTSLGFRPINCIRLERGNFLSETKVERFFAASFEDCFWLAHRRFVLSHLTSSNKVPNAGVLFAYSESQCILDDLYRIRELSGHEAEIEGANVKHSLNYFTHEFGSHEMFTIDMRLELGREIVPEIVPESVTHGMKLIGKRFKLEVYQSNETNIKLDYKIGSAKVVDKLINQSSGELTSFSHVRNFRGLSWSPDQSDENGKNTFLSMSSNLKPDSGTLLPGESFMMTENLCKSICLHHAHCQSFSYCSRQIRSNPQGGQCFLSSIDIEHNDVEKQLMELSAKASRKGTHQLNKPLIEMLGLTNGRVGVELNRKCSISGKAYGELFKKIPYPVKIELNARIETIEVTDENQCAHRCFEQNLRISEKSLQHNDLAHRIKEDLLKSGANATFSKLESFFDAYYKHAKDLCTHFLFNAGNSIKDDEDQVKGICILAGSDVVSKLDSTVSIAKSNQIQVNMYRLIYINLFEGKRGVRFKESSGGDLNETQNVKSLDNIDKNAKLTRSSVSNYKRLIRLHLEGYNRQEKFPMEDVEHCARACILQTHGPRPMCSSFDFVYERPIRTTDATYINQDKKYCLLNSLGVADLKRWKRTEDQTLHEDEVDSSQFDVQFWHYEPIATGVVGKFTKNEEQRSDVVAIGNGDIYESEDFETDDTMVIESLQQIESELRDAVVVGAILRLLPYILTLLAIISGLAVGSKLGKRIIESERSDPAHGERHTVRRFVHRLSGVSISQAYRASEIRM